MNEMILRSELFTRIGIKHGFSTRLAGDVLGSLRQWEHESGLSRNDLIWLNQVHGTDVLVVDGPAASVTARPDLSCDAAVSDREDVVLTVRTADCVPVLLFCPRPRAVGIVHAGWRGTLAGAVTSAVSSMQENYGCLPEDMLAAIGPCIQPCCYEVGSDVYDPFLERFGSEMVSMIGSARYVHLAATNRLWLMQCGLPAENIETIELCTCCRKETFFSYRREGKTAGRQLAHISLSRKGLA
jgi:polyphenol oxidase